MQKKESKKESVSANSKITALYVRVSTNAQYEEGYSIEAQTEKLKIWCKSRDYTNYEVYEDGGWSGSNLNRPAMERLLFDIYQGKIERVVVYKLDRLSRSQKDTLYLLEDVFLPNNVEFYSHNENIDTGTAFGRAITGVMSVFAQLERDNIRERTRMGMQERIKEGKWPGGGIIPFGYDYDSNLDILVPNENANDVKDIFRLYLEGYSMTQLSEMFPVANDSHIAHILGRVTYLGKIPYKGEIYNGLHEALIDQETWDRVQSARNRRTQKGTSHSQYLLSGLLVCGKCGAKMRYQKWGPDNVKIYCYSQQSSKKYLIEDVNCDNLKYNAADLEKYILSDLFAVTETIVAAQDVIKNSASSQYSSISTLLKQKKNIEQKIKNLYNKYAENPNDILYETIQDNLLALEAINKSLESEQASAKAITDVSEKTKILANLKNTWDSYTIDEKKGILKMCIKQIVLTDNCIDIQYLV